MDSRHRTYADEMHEQSLSRIRQRISGLGESRNIGLKSGNETSATLQNSKGRYNGFSGKLESLDLSCKQLLESINELNAQKRTIATRVSQLKEDLMKNLEVQQESRKLVVNELARSIKQGIRQANERNRKIEETYFQNLEGNNKIKINLVDLRNKINEIQHRLGCHATIWQKI